MAKCPFCSELTIKALHKPIHLEPKVSHISAGSKNDHRALESHETLSGYSACGKSRKEVQKMFDTGMTKELGHEERLKRLRNAGLALRTAAKHNKKAAV